MFRASRGRTRFEAMRVISGPRCYQRDARGLPPRPAVLLGQGGAADPDRGSGWFAGVPARASGTSGPRANTSSARCSGPPSGLAFLAPLEHPPAFPRHGAGGALGRVSLGGDPRPSEGLMRAPTRSRLASAGLCSAPRGDTGLGRDADGFANPEGSGFSGPPEPRAVPSGTDNPELIAGTGIAWGVFRRLSSR